MGFNPLAGAEKEFNSEFKLPDNVMPWEALLPKGEDSETEKRVDANTTITDAVRPTNENGIIRRVFRRTDAAALGYQMA